MKHAIPADQLQLQFIEHIRAACTCQAESAAPELHALDCTFRVRYRALAMLRPTDFQVLHTAIWNAAVEASAEMADSLRFCSHEYREDVAEEIRGHLKR